MEDGVLLGVEDQISFTNIQEYLGGVVLCKDGRNFTYLEKAGSRMTFWKQRWCGKVLRYVAPGYLSYFHFSRHFQPAVCSNCPYVESREEELCVLCSGKYMRLVKRIAEQSAWIKYKLKV